MSCEQPLTDFQILHHVAIEPSQPIASSTRRKQRLLRCGLKFYFVYEDDGSLVEGEEPTGPNS